MTIITAIAHQKGGTGKSATAINLAYEAVTRQRMALIIDMDGQGTATHGLVGEQPKAPDASTFGVIMGRATWGDIIVLTQVENLHLAPSHRALTQLQAQLGAAGITAGQERQLVKRISKLKGYDHIFVDCPPALDTATICALVASHEVVIPTQLEAASVEVLPNIVNLLNLIEEDVGVSVPIRAIVPSMSGTRANLEQNMLEDLREAYSDIVTTTKIRRSIKVPEAHANRLPVGAYLPEHAVTSDYCALYSEIWGD